ncbi:MAG: serine hydrolase [Gemmatimonadota bacterium]|nr:serine hydrolase [Gemmatimonadota bacterium]
MKRVEIRGVVLLATVMVWGCAPEQDSVSQSGDLASRIEASLNSLNAKTSFYAKHLPSGREIAIRADEPMNALSVIKIPIMVLAYRDADAGTLELDERYQIQPEDMRRGSGLLQSFSPGIEPTYRDIITQMIITSDNTATDVVIKRLGLERVNTMLAEMGFDQTRLRATTGELFRAVLELAAPGDASLSDRDVFESGFPSDPEAAVRSFGFEGDSTQWLGRITAREISHMLEAIEENELASPESSDEMIGILRRQFYSSRLPQQLRGRASIAHKTGDWPPHAGNDAGILYYEGGPTVVAVFTNQNQGDFFELEAALGRIAVDLVDSWR